MEASKAIRTGYFLALNGNITSNGNNVPIFDVYALPENTPYPYVLLSTQTAVQLDVKRCKRYNTRMLIDIVTASDNPIGRSEAEDIAEQIEDIVIPSTFTDIDLTAYGYELLNTKREQDTDASLMNGTKYIYRKLITYSSLTVKL